MTTNITRRDFIKLTSTLFLTPLYRHSPTLHASSRSQHKDIPNVIFILFDAMSANNLSLYGYPRKTTPNLERFAEKSIVYQSHHSAGNYTTPSTASLFTSSYPWTHGAYYLNSLIRNSVKHQNIFELLSDVYYQAVYSQNLFADTLLYQFHNFHDRHIGLDSYSIVGNTFYNNLFENDAINGLKSYDQFLFKREEAHGSLLLSILNDLSILLPKEIHSQELAHIHPNGLPRIANTDVYFLNEQVMQGVMVLLSKLQSPFFTYIHLIPPHSPYRPTSQFLGMFEDGWSPEPKKRHRLSLRTPQERLNTLRQSYDEFIANMDMELGRLLNHVENLGLLENSYVIVTSDHGELFERGDHGHSTPLLFEPVIRIPLIISTPGRHERRDIFSHTSNVDLLPTLLNIAGLPIPEWSEGHILPGLGGEESADRSIYAVEAKKNPARSPLRKATISLLKDQYKLIHYLGYRSYDHKYELYDLKNDPEELHNLFPSHPASKEMQQELDRKLKDVNQPYLSI